MGLPTSIETLIEGTIVESARIEFKETWDPQASLKTICAFANDIDNWGGGYLVIGVREDTAGYRTVVGVPTDKVDLWLKDMSTSASLSSPTTCPLWTLLSTRQSPHRRLGARRKRAPLLLP